MKKSQDQSKAEEDKESEEETGEKIGGKSEEESKEQEQSYTILHDEALFRRELLLRFDNLNSILSQILEVVKPEDKKVVPKK